MSMNVFENPFYMLGASPRDSRRRIYALAEEKAFLSDSEAIAEARNALIIPQKRLEAELRWFPGVQNENLAIILESLLSLQAGDKRDYKWLDIDVDDEPHCIARVNFSVYVFYFCCIADVSNLVNKILDIAYDVNFLDNETLDTEINEDREFAGFPKAHKEEIDDEFCNYLWDIVKVLSEKLKKLSLEDYADVAYRLAETQKYIGDELLLDNLLDDYELCMAPYLEEQKQMIIDATTDIGSDKKNLTELIKKWGILSLPSLLVAHSRGVEHSRLSQDSEAIFKAVRRMALVLHNQHDRAEDSLQLALVLKESLSGLNANSSEMLDDDINVLTSIIQKKKEKKEREEVTAAAVIAEAEKKQRKEEAFFDELTHRVSQLEDLKLQITNTAKYIRDNIEVDLELGIKLLLSLVEKWDIIAQPLRQIAPHHELMYRKVCHEAEEIVYTLRQLSVFLHSRCSKLQEALQLALTLKKYFFWLSSNFTILFDDDIKTLESLMCIKQEHKQQWRDGREFDKRNEAEGVPIEWRRLLYACIVIICMFVLFALLLPWLNT